MSAQVVKLRLLTPSWSQRSTRASRAAAANPNRGWEGGGSRAYGRRRARMMMMMMMVVMRHAWMSGCGGWREDRAGGKGWLLGG
eukprot:scaffold459_cov391-Prasinococcus_capsulatus_cf.AAC.9